MRLHRIVEHKKTHKNIEGGNALKSSSPIADLAAHTTLSAVSNGPTCIDGDGGTAAVRACWRPAVDWKPSQAVERHSNVEGRVLNKSNSKREIEDVVGR